MVKKKSPAGKPAPTTIKSSEVDEFMAKLRHPLKAEIEAVRAIVLGADKRINERVKWNAPSFFIEEHFATLKLHPPQNVQVVFHTGAKVKSDSREMHIDDPDELLKWVAKDRCVATFSDMRQIEARAPALKSIVKQWVAQM